MTTVFTTDTGLGTDPPVAPRAIVDAKVQRFGLHGLGLDRCRREDSDSRDVGSRRHFDRIWRDFSLAGFADPVAVVEQLGYLLAIKRLDECQTAEERRARASGLPLQSGIFPEGVDEGGRPFADLRWSYFKSLVPPEMFTVVDQHVFPFLRALANARPAVGLFLKGARLRIRSPALLARTVETLDRVESSVPTPVPTPAGRSPVRRMMIMQPADVR